MSNTLKKRTLFFVLIIYFISALTIIITKNASISLEVILTITLFAFFYVKYYPTGNAKKERLLNRLAFTIGILYIWFALIGFVLIYIYEL